MMFPLAPRLAADTVTDFRLKQIIQPRTDGELDAFGYKNFGKGEQFR